MDQSLANFIKYCLGYVRITQERTVAAQQKFSVNLPTDYFGLQGLLNGEEDGSLGELISLNTFYKYDPKEVPEEEKKQYEREKEFAVKIEEIYNKYRNDQFTKQIIFNFGYFEVEIPLEQEDGDIENEEEAEETLFPVTPPTKRDRYPLFALPIRIDKEITKQGVGKYYIYSADPEIKVNIGMLQSVLGEDLYFQLLEGIGKFEVEGRLSLPICDLEVFKEIWHIIKAQLKLKDAKFDEDSFSLDEIKLALSPRANYFLAEDLAKLSKLSAESLNNTSLNSWVSDEDLNTESELPKENDLYFPFLYDKFQLSTLSILGNKASIIQGPPGTGKSETISNILCHLAATGKRVLFVSQKAQALKVVKDKLKKLNIKYLYGYLPNPNSSQIGEEDEADGIAPQLTALGTHIDRVGRTQAGEGMQINQILENKDKYKNVLNTLFKNERKSFELYQELVSLEQYNIDISDYDNFSKTFSSKEWNVIKKSKSEMENLAASIDKYKEDEEKEKLDGVFSGLLIKGQHFADAVKKINEDVFKTGYDRHSKFFRGLNNTWRNVRTGSVRNKLPREIIDYIDSILSSDFSKNEAIRRLDILHRYCSFFENLEQIELMEEKMKEVLVSCGVSNDEFEIIDNLIDSTDSDGLEDVKSKILRVQEIKMELQELMNSQNINDAFSHLKTTELNQSQRVVQYIQNIVNKNIIQKWKTGVAIRQVIQKLARAFGKSKKAFKTFDNLRKDAGNFNAILDLIPIWIMELDDASRIIPLETNVFDYVILDEASQCNIAYTLPVMYRAKHTIFVGDSEQMRDSTIMFKSNRILDELAHRYGIPEERQIKSTGSAVQSVLDIAKNRGFLYKTLHYHYRSPAELIGFSNKYFYKPNGKNLIPLNSNYLTYNDTNRVMLIHEIVSDFTEEISDNVNVAEAKAILELFEELRGDEKYKDKSIGILSFFNAQATFIRELFEKSGFKEEEDNYKVSIIEGIQGDEKDIVIYSFVIRNPDQRKRYMPLTGEGGDIKGDINKGRVNVAFSRAKQQTHCFISMPISDVPDKIWLKKYLEYVEENGEVAINSTDLKGFDSYFEEEFYRLMSKSLKRGYKIQNQVESCGFRIDFVISNSNSGKKIAVECDGPTHFKNEIDEAYGIHIESDEERQRVLEAAGWRFYRIKYSDWINDNFDPKSVVEDVVELLK